MNSFIICYLKIIIPSIKLIWAQIPVISPWTLFFSLSYHWSLFSSNDLKFRRKTEFLLRKEKNYFRFHKINNFCYQPLMTIKRIHEKVTVVTIFLILIVFIIVLNYLFMFLLFNIINSFSLILELLYSFPGLLIQFLIFQKTVIKIFD